MISKDRSFLDRIVTALTNEQTGSMFLEQCASVDPSLMSRIPLRYQIIAYGFAHRFDLNQLNDMLNEHGCARLYSRSVWESSLIYAFANRMSYESWKELRDECLQLRERKESRDKYFNESKVSLHSIKAYLDDNSDMGENSMNTSHLTQMLNRKIEALSSGKGEFKDFLAQNVMLMSPVREKCRYYFCKYLYYYLISCRDRYLQVRGMSGQVDEEAMSELAVFKGLTAIKRKKMTDEEVIALLDDSGISFGEIFDAFNFYFFDYVSLDWMEVLLDYYGNIGSIPENDRQELAASLRKYDPGKYSGLTDDDVIRIKQEELEERESDLDRIYSIGNKDRNCPASRAGENTIRKYVKGSLDIDRTTLICFLLFFGNSSDLPPVMVPDKDRINEILVECGFPELRNDDDFDDFVLGYIGSAEPVDYLMNIVTDYAMDEENFFLYRMYKASRSAEEDFLKIAS